MSKKESACENLFSICTVCLYCKGFPLQNQGTAAFSNKAEQAVIRSQLPNNRVLDILDLSQESIVPEGLPFILGT